MSFDNDSRLPRPRTLIHVQEENEPSPETALFATTQAVGIVDLGASQTVMGQHQVPEFLSSLPADVRKLVHERPVQSRVEMTFRFGNNSIAPCNRAIFVSIDRFWIKIAVVESRTPFLISNNVCRSLGAVIDTNRQSILFKTLNCEMPPQSSAKKLFLLDFCALTAMRPPTSTVSDTSGKTQGSSESQVFHVHEPEEEMKSIVEPKSRINQG